MSSESNSDSESVGSEVYEVEIIMGKRIRYGGIEYFIKWKNYSQDDNTWEPIKNLSCQQLIDDYEANDAPDDDELEWLPKPVKILEKKIVDGTVDFLIKWDNGIQSMVALTYGPMKKLIAEYELKQSNKKRPNQRNSLKRNSNPNQNETQGEKGRKVIIIDSTYSDEVERVHDMRRTKLGVMFFVEYKDSEDLEWVPKDVVTRNHPLKVIEFYERCITWEN